MAQAVYTEAMAANATKLLETAHCWTRGIRKADALAFVLFPSGSREGVGYMTNESGCTCPGFTYRATCSHVLAVRLEARQARERFVVVDAHVSDPALGLVEAFG